MEVQCNSVVSEMSRLKSDGLKDNRRATLPTKLLSNAASNAAAAVRLIMPGKVEGPNKTGNAVPIYDRVGLHFTF